MDTCFLSVKWARQEFLLPQIALVTAISMVHTVRGGPLPREDACPSWRGFCCWRGFCLGLPFGDSEPDEDNVILQRGPDRRAAFSSAGRPVLEAAPFAAVERHPLSKRFG